MDELCDAHLLIVDDSETNILLLEKMLQRQGYSRITSLTNPAETVGVFEESVPDLLLLDLQMPVLDGFEVMEMVKPWTTGEASVPILVLTADASQETKLRALECGARDFLSKPLDAGEVTLRIRNLLQTRQLQLQLQSVNATLEARVRDRTRELERSRTEAFQRLAMAAEYRDDDTREHTKRVGITSGMLAAQLGLAPEMVEVIERIAPLHDLGKIGIPDAILLKPGRLTDGEREVMQTHATIGADILSGDTSPLLAGAAEIARTHHERWDGTGYPVGLAAEEIPISGRIVALADAFDAMTHDRPYKEAMSLADAIAEIERSAGTHFDPSVVAAFIALDPELLQSPPMASAATALTDAAWQTLDEMTGIDRNGTRSAGPRRPRAPRAPGAPSRARLPRRW